MKPNPSLIESILAAQKEGWDWNVDMELLKDKQAKHINDNVINILSFLQKKKEE
jgi:hypothetical protein